MGVVRLYHFTNYFSGMVKYINYIVCTLNCLKDGTGISNGATVALFLSMKEAFFLTTKEAFLFGMKEAFLFSKKEAFFFSMKEVFLFSKGQGKANTIIQVAWVRYVCRTSQLRLGHQPAGLYQY